MQIRLLLTLPMLLLAVSGFTQEANSNAFKKSLYNADILFEDGQYLRALALYDSLGDIDPESNLIQYKIGICNVHKSNGRDKAYDILKDVSASSGFPDVKFWMARAKHLNYFFEDAIQLYNEYLETNHARGANRINTLNYIQNCENGIELMKRKLNLSLEILSPPSNPTNSQYSPVISPDGKKLYYTNRGPESRGEIMDNTAKKKFLGNYYEDVFVVERSDSTGPFNPGSGLSNKINSLEHEAPLSISYDNKILFLYKSTVKNEEDIYYSEREDEADSSWSAPKKVKGINTPYWEGHACLAPDGRTLYFSSDRPGGYGGRDLYSAIRKSDGSYGNVRNLGPKVNTEFNEDAPFMYSNGTSLYFASEGHQSMGGYDMHYIKYDSATNDWQEPINLGYPINTTDDDRFYYITTDGSFGYFSSARASGENLHDIYQIKPGSFERLNRLVILIGTVYINDVPGVAVIKIADDNTGKQLTTLVTDSTTGEFVYSLNPCQRYKIVILAEGFQPKFDYVDVPCDAEGILRIEHRFNLYSQSYLALKGDTLGIGLQDELDTKLKLVMEEDNEPGFTFSELDVSSEQELEPETLTDAQMAAGLRFRVQVGAYRNPGKFRYGFLRSLDFVEIKTYDDGITRYLMGQTFLTRSEAEVLRMKCIELGEWDAWITIR